MEGGSALGSGETAPGEPRVCVACDAPAAYYNEDADEDPCVACGIYLAGQQHGKAAIAHEWLGDAIAELLAATLTREHIDAMADGELEGIYRPTGPDIARPGSMSLAPVPARPDRVMSYCVGSWRFAWMSRRKAATSSSIERYRQTPTTSWR